MTIELDGPLDVDREALLELARGSNLYEDRFAFARELVQNAVDATLLRVFAERGAEAFPTHERSLIDLRALLAEHPIDVSVERVSGNPVTDEPRTYRVVVEDRGIGIAPSDVVHLQRIGSSRKNPVRAALVAAMPEWMRPSGTFGIGLQSAFMVTAELRICSCAANEQALDITLAGTSGGTISVREGMPREVGTRVELMVSGVDETGSRWTSVAQRRDDLSDLLVDPPLDTVLEGALELVRAIAGASLVPIRIDGVRCESGWSAAGAVFDVETSIEFLLPASDAAAADLLSHRPPALERGPRLFYRGAPIEDYFVPLGQIGWSCNLHFATARQVLLLGRDRPTGRGEEIIAARCEDLLRRRLPAHLAVLANAGASTSLSWCSEFLFEHGHEAAGTAWRAVGGASRSLQRIADPDLTLGRLAELDALQLTQGMHVRTPSGELVTPMRSGALARLFPGLHATAAGEFRTRASGVVIEDAALARDIDTGQPWEASVRPECLGPDDFARVRLPVERSRAARRSLHELSEPTVMLSPWVVRDRIVTVPALDRWVEWTAHERGEDATAHAEIAGVLASLLRRFDPVLRAKSDWRVDYDLDAAIAALEAHSPIRDA